MSLSKRDAAITILTFTLFIVANRYKYKLDCGDEPLNSWFVGCIFILFVFTCAKLLKPFFEVYQNSLYWIRLIIIPLAIALFTFWIIIGAIWVLRNLLSKNRCLPLIIYFLILWSIFVVIASLLAAAVIMIIIKIRQIPETIEKKRVKESLIALYTNKEYASQTAYNTFMGNVWVVLESEPVLDIEKDLIRKYYSHIIDIDENELCNVCLGQFTVGDVKSAIACKHGYHYDCIINWLSIKPTCPCCKTHFRPALIRIQFEYINEDIEMNNRD